MAGQMAGQPRQAATSDAMPGDPGALARAADIPSLDRLLNAPALAALAPRYGRTQLVAALRSHLDTLRQAALAGTLPGTSIVAETVAAQVQAALEAAARPPLACRVQSDRHRAAYQSGPRAAAR